MHEYQSEALVLTLEPHRETDSRVSLFTERFGKMQARARSARKITSKLSAHLQPGFFARVRLIEKSGVQVVDALNIRKSGFSLPGLALLDGLLPVFHAEPELWRMLAEGTFSWRDALRVLGWDPAHARCRVCGASVEYFSTGDQEFYCAPCAGNSASQAGGDGLILLERIRK